ncbi:MAG: DUF4123 domain-containing protein [Burkholderiales bacterium]|nr:DUF4123 domain-containing protein [Burkholderiales bacterium]
MTTRDAAWADPRLLPLDGYDDWVRCLWPQGDRPQDTQVHLIVDAARDARIYPLLQQTGLERCCLFAGPLAPELRAAAPYLVHLAPDAHFTRQFFTQGWGHGWGVLTLAPPDVTLPLLRRHLRSLLRVRDEAGRWLMFRFFDPRVLGVYLPTCTGEEAARVFGPIHRFGLEQGPDALRLFRQPAHADHP